MQQANNAANYQWNVNNQWMNVEDLWRAQVAIMQEQEHERQLNIIQEHVQEHERQRQGRNA